MAKPKKPAKTIHHMDVAASLAAQNQAVNMLVQAVRMAITLDGEKMWRRHLPREERTAGPAVGFV